MDINSARRQRRQREYNAAHNWYTNYPTAAQLLAEAASSCDSKCCNCNCNRIPTPTHAAARVYREIDRGRREGKAVDRGKRRRNRVARISVWKLAALEGAYSDRSHSCSLTRLAPNDRQYRISRIEPLASQGSVRGVWGRCCCCCCLSIIATRPKTAKYYLPSNCHLASQAVRQSDSHRGHISILPRTLPAFNNGQSQSQLPSETVSVSVSESDFHSDPVSSSRSRNEPLYHSFLLGADSCRRRWHFGHICRLCDIHSSCQT